MVKVYWGLLLTAGCSAPTFRYAGGPTERGDTQAEAGVDDSAIGMDTGAHFDVYARYASAETCGECHPVHFAEWRESMHAYAAHSPVFDAMALRAYRDASGEIGTFCTGCHTPLGALDGESGLSTAETRSVRSLEGITCSVCHQAVDHSSIVGNAGLVLDSNAPIQAPHSDAIDERHAVEEGNLLTQPALCGSCHDVFKYPGLLVEQAYTEHLESPSAVSGTTCQDCHMSPDPGQPSPRPVEPVAVGGDYPARPRASHRFVGPDVALLDTWPYGPDRLAENAAAREQSIARTQSLLERAVEISSADIQSDTSGTTLMVDVHSLTNGHRVPTGFTSERQLWVSVTAYAPDGTLCFATGDLDKNGDLRDEHSEEVRAGHISQDIHLVNFQSVNHTVTREYQEDGAFDYSSAPVLGTTMFPFEAQYIERKSLTPGETRSVAWRLPCPSRTQIAVALRYRNLPPHLLSALGVGDLSDRLPVYTLDTVELSIP